MDDIAEILAKACEEADKAAQAMKVHGDTGAIGSAYVVVPPAQKQVLKVLKSGKYGGGFGVTSGVYRGYQWEPRLSEFFGQALHFYAAAAEAAVKVLKEHGIDASVRYHWD